MMAWLISWLGPTLGAFAPYLVGILATVGVWFGARKSGVNAERAKQLKREVQARDQAMDDIARAADAGRGQLPDIANDPRNRDRP